MGRGAFANASWVAVALIASACHDRRRLASDEAPARPAAEMSEDGGSPIRDASIADAGTDTASQAASGTGSLMIPDAALAALAAAAAICTTLGCGATPGDCGEGAPCCTLLHAGGVSRCFPNGCLPSTCLEGYP